MKNFLLARCSTILLTLLVIPSTSFASHHFKICYYNYSKQAVQYNNNGGSLRWKNRGELTGRGTLEANTGKCFNHIEDETIVRTDNVSFYIDGKKITLANAAFSRPYIMAQDADVDNSTRKSSFITEEVQGGKSHYSFNVFVMADNSLVISNSEDPNDQNARIKPRSLQ